MVVSADTNQKGTNLSSFFHLKPDFSQRARSPKDREPNQGKAVSRQTAVLRFNKAAAVTVISRGEDEALNTVVGQFSPRGVHVFFLLSF